MIPTDTEGHEQAYYVQPEVAEAKFIIVTDSPGFERVQGPYCSEDCAIDAALKFARLNPGAYRGTVYEAVAEASLSTTAAAPPTLTFLI